MVNTSTEKKETKWDRDYQKRLHAVVDATAFLNHLLTEGYTLTSIHLCSRWMTVQEKMKYNRHVNRTQSSSLEKAMGSDLKLTYTQKENFVYIRYVFKSGKNMYMKLPQEYKDNWEGYLYGFVEKQDYYVIVIDEIAEKKYKISHPIHISVFLQDWKPELQQSKGNKNRIQFHGPFSKIVCTSPLRVSMREGIKGTKIEHLQNLIK